MSKAWDNFRAWQYHSVDPQFRLDLSRMDLPAGTLERMALPLQRAFDAMQALERGAQSNPDEKRQVGHYWLRAPDLAPDGTLARAIVDTQDRVREFAAKVHQAAIRPPQAERFEAFLLIGIGGSALGPQLISGALGGAEDRLRAHFLDNTDPDGIDRTLAGIDPARTLTLVVSKSGGTPETRNGMLETAAVYRRAGLEFGRHAVAVTGAGSRLDEFARELEFLDRFPMWDCIGGRTSVTSAVGLLPAALQGIDTAALLEGAAAMDRLTRTRRPLRNPAALLAVAWHAEGAGRGLKDMVILPYKDRLALFSRYLQQLVMESLGKAKDQDGNVVHQGIAVYGNKGSTDQHAYVQQLRDGLPNFFVTFIEVLRDRDRSGIELEPGVTSGDYLQGFLLGTRRALHDNGRRSLTITIPSVDPLNLGMLIALYERAVGLYATLIGVNAYHQPGVEAGKQAAADVLELQSALLRALRERAAEGGTASDLARLAGRPDEEETAFLLLERLAANPGRGVFRSTSTSPFDALYRMGPD